MYKPKLKLKSQLALFNAFSKVTIIGLLVFLIPLIVSQISIKDTDQVLIQKLDDVIELIDSLGLEQYIDKDAEFKAFGSYNILKEEYISIEQQEKDTLLNIIQYTQRIIEDELVDYRVLSYSIIDNGNIYLIEIGKSIETIYRFEQNLNRFAFLFLIVIVSLTFVVDLSFIQYLLVPFEKIVKKLRTTNHPTSFDFTP